MLRGWIDHLAYDGVISIRDATFQPLACQKEPTGLKTEQTPSNGCRNGSDT